MRNQWALSDRLKCPIVAQNTSLSVTLRASNEDKINTQAKRKVIQTRSEIICFNFFSVQHKTQQSRQSGQSSCNLQEQLYIPRVQFMGSKTPCLHSLALK